MISILAVVVIAAVFFHGQFAEGSPLKAPARYTATAVIALIIGYLGYALTWCWAFGLLAAVSSGRAFTSGPEIGWNSDVRRTQAIKGAWLAAPLFPFGLVYAALRPLAYWIGYTKAKKYQDEISRLLSGVFLAAVCVAAYLAAGLLAERLEAGAVSRLFFPHDKIISDDVKLQYGAGGLHAA